MKTGLEQIRFGGLEHTHAKFEARRGPFSTHSHPPQKSMPAPAYLRPSSAGNRDFSFTLRHELPAERADPEQPERDPTANEQQATDHTDQHDPKGTTEHPNSADCDALHYVFENPKRLPNADIG